MWVSSRGLPRSGLSTISGAQTQILDDRDSFPFAEGDLRLTTRTLEEQNHQRLSHFYERRGDQIMPDHMSTTPRIGVRPAILTDGGPHFNLP